MLYTKDELSWQISCTQVHKYLDGNYISESEKKESPKMQKTAASVIILELFTIEIRHATP